MTVIYAVNPSQRKVIWNVINQFIVGKKNTRVKYARNPSKQEVALPLKLSKKKRAVLYASIVNANIPLLIGAPDMKRLGLTINFEKDKAYISSTREYFEIKKNGNGHLTIPLKLDPLAAITYVKGGLHIKIEKRN